MSGDLHRIRTEQTLAGDYIRAALAGENDGSQLRGAMLGASDWVMEEVLLMASSAAAMAHREAAKEGGES